MEKIKSYEDALKKLGKEQPNYLNYMPKHEQAYHKLCTIAEALNKGQEKNRRIYIPEFYRESLLENVDGSSCDGIGCIYSRGRFSASIISISDRLCLCNEKTAMYMGGKLFFELWRDYILGGEKL